MQDLITRMSSRKFLLALAAFLVAVAHGDVMAAVVVVLGYLGVNVVEAKA